MEINSQIRNLVCISKSVCSYAHIKNELGSIAIYRLTVSRIDISGPDSPSARSLPDLEIE